MQRRSRWDLRRFRGAYSAQKSGSSEQSVLGDSASLTSNRLAWSLTKMTHQSQVSCYRPVIWPIKLRRCSWRLPLSSNWSTIGEASATRTDCWTSSWDVKFKSGKSKRKGANTLKCTRSIYTSTTCSVSVIAWIRIWLFSGAEVTNFLSWLS